MTKMIPVIARSSKKIPVEFGMKDYYDFYNKNYPFKVSKSVFNNVISDLHKFIVEEVVDKADDFMLPHRMGYISVVKIKKGVKLLPNNTVINNSPPDWRATNLLWKNDLEAAAKKIIVRYKRSLAKRINDYTKEKFNAHEIKI